MKSTVMIIMGSHRKRGNSAFFADRLKMAFEKKGYLVAYFDVNELKIEHCTDCGYCNRNYASCVFKDDMTMVYEAFKSHRHVIFISPVYMNNVTSLLKTIIDRCQMIFMCDFTHKKPFVSDLTIDESKVTSIYANPDKNFGTGTGIIVSLGGARAYENQYLGTELTLGLIFKNLRIPLRQHIKFNGTDHVALKDRLSEVDNAIGQIIDEVIANEAKI